MNARGKIVLTILILGVVGFGAWKWWDRLTAKPGAPYGLYVHGNNDTTGAVRAVESIVQALGWRRVVAPAEVIGAVGKQQTDEVWNVAATVAASLVG